MSLLHCVVCGRTIGQVADHVCDGFHDSLSRPVHNVCVGLQLGDESVFHCLVVRYCISDVFQVPCHVRPQPRHFPAGVPSGANGWSCRTCQPRILST